MCFTNNKNQQVERGQIPLTSLYRVKEILYTALGTLNQKHVTILGILLEVYESAINEVLHGNRNGGQVSVFTYSYG